MKTSEELEQHHQSLVEHLSELRIRLVYALVGVGLAAIACYNFSELIFDIVRKPILPYLPQSGLVFTSPADKFMAHIKVSIFSGIFISAPFWFYQIWKFISPGLYKNEKRYAVGFISSGSLLFLAGVLLCYFGVLPLAFEFLMGFGGTVDSPMITISEYLSFFVMMNLVFGVSFELPLVLVVLGMMGIIDQKFLRDKRRYSIVGLAFLAAVLTPSDVVSMLLLFIPLALLYEVAILLVGFFAKKNKI